MFSPVLKTFIFLGTLSALLVAIGYSVGGPQQAWFFFFISLLINLGAYWFSDRIALGMSGAKPLSQEEAPDLYVDLENLCKQMNIPMPKVYYSSELQANAFATGRNPRHSSICFTLGILQLLDRKELLAVAAHELSHIKNRDVLIATVAAVLASAISGLSRIAIFSGGSGDRDRDNVFGNILMVLLAPFAAFLIQMAISRQREFEADASGTRVTRHPEDLARALKKIEESVSRHPMGINPAIATLYIENPLHLSGVMKLLATHPPTSERIERLLSMKLPS